MAHFQVNPMKGKLISLPCRHWSGRTVAGEPSTERYWAIELSETGSGEPVRLQIPMGCYPLTPDGYEDHEAARRILVDVLAGSVRWTVVDSE